jgi:uncharacterized protein
VGLIPRDQHFYQMFNEIAGRLSASATLLSQLFNDPANIDRYVAEIKKIEHEADELTRDVIVRINKSFVTPFDREDIHMLASRLDDVVDLLDGTARRAAMFHITEIKEPAKQLTNVLQRAAVSIASAVAEMRKPAMVLKRSMEIKQLEEEGDAIYHAAVGGLFKGTPDPLEIIKWKELYDTLERAIDLCEDVSNVLESISLKNA